MTQIMASQMTSNDQRRVKRESAIVQAHIAVIGKLSTEDRYKLSEWAAEEFIVKRGYSCSQVDARLIRRAFRAVESIERRQS